MKILMVCLGNICRSPLAEGIMKQQVKEAGLDWEVGSAGNLHIGKPPVSGHCSKPPYRQEKCEFVILQV